MNRRTFGQTAAGLVLGVWAICRPRKARANRYLTEGSPVVECIKMTRQSVPPMSARGLIVVIQEKHLDGIDVDQLIERAERTARHMVLHIIEMHKKRECCRRARRLNKTPWFRLTYCEKHDPEHYLKGWR